MTTWEYDYVEAEDHKQLVAALKDKGADRWELVGFEIMHGFWLGVLKRPAVAG